MSNFFLICLFVFSFTSSDCQDLRTVKKEIKLDSLPKKNYVENFTPPKDTWWDGGRSFNEKRKNSCLVIRLTCYNKCLPQDKDNFTNRIGFHKR